MKKSHALLWACSIAVAACGARSPLGVPEGQPGEASAGAGGGIVDAGPDVFDAGPDAFEAGPDVEPPSSCADAGTTYIYVITQENALYRFYPPDLSFVPIGFIDCPTPVSEAPFSMAVDRKGTAYVLFDQGDLFKVSTATATCKATKFVPGNDGFNTRFGMGFSANTSDPGETLFIAGDEGPEQLGTIDLGSLAITTVGSFSSTIGNAELTGTGDAARLFAFGIDPGAVGPHLAEIDKATAAVLSDDILNLDPNVVGWAFAFWGGDFYFFTSTAPGKSSVNRYHPDDKSMTLVATLDNTIVGAGVSTCAPE